MPTTLTVSQFLDSTNSLLKSFSAVVQGEITSISNRGHIYFCLSDKDESAILNCALWKSIAAQVPFDLKEGMEVQVIGKANIYKPNGRYTFIVDRIAPVGDGALKQAFERLKAKLEAAGYFDPAKKQPIPKYPNCIGLITSQNGDAIKDFMTHLGEFGIKVYHKDVFVEGIHAVDSVVEAIEWFNKNPREIETLVITRGGGSLESLQAFNSEEVAKAIFASRIPVVSAIGHERDVTIADLVADVRASTPTDAGKVLSFHWRQASDIIADYNRYITEKIRREIAQYQSKINAMWQNSVQLFASHLHTQSHQLLSYQQHFLSYIQLRLSHFQNTKNTFLTNVRRFDEQHERVMERLAFNQVQLRQKFEHTLKLCSQHLSNLETQLTLSDPRLKLKQGYSIVFAQSGKVVKGPSDISVGETITVQTAQALIESNITKIAERSHE